MLPDEPAEGRGPPPAGDARRQDEQRLDELQRLWTPWRMSYIRNPDERIPGCPFCVLPERGDREALIVYRAPRSYVVLNAYPYNPGHLMIVPFRHVDGYDDLSADEVAEIAALSQRSVRALKAASGPHAFNLGMNVGAVAGAGIADHIHQHVVPRWGGDTNFMPVIGQTRVLPELLEETYDRLVPAFAEG
jgi:ATP adenylyltransferase